MSLFLFCLACVCVCVFVLMAFKADGAPSFQTRRNKCLRKLRTQILLRNFKDFFHTNTCFIRFMLLENYYYYYYINNTRWFKYDRDYLCVNKSQFVPVIFEPPCRFEPGYNDIGLCDTLSKTLDVMWYPLISYCDVTLGCNNTRL
jgi:hypothetical protein